MVVMYTLRRCGTRRLEGPLNKRHYVTFASKRRAFEVAQREAIKRGFGPKSGRVVQLVTDGDDDLSRLAAEYLPHAEHTIDVYHVFEKLWNAVGALFPEGSPEAKAWVDEQKQRLFLDDAEGVLKEFDRRLARIAKTGPGTKAKRDRLNASRKYIAKRVAHIRYGSLRRRDLVIGSGVVEGPSSSCSRSAATTGGCAGSRSASRPSLSSDASSSTATGKPSSASSTSDNASLQSSTPRHHASSSLRPRNYVMPPEDGHGPICTQFHPNPGSAGKVMAAEHFSFHDERARGSREKLEHGSESCTLQSSKGGIIPFQSASEDPHPRKFHDRHSIRGVDCVDAGEWVRRQCRLYSSGRRSCGFGDRRALRYRRVRCSGRHGDCGCLHRSG